MVRSPAESLPPSGTPSRLDLQAVVREEDAGRQRRFGRRMRQVMTNVREIRLLRAQRLSSGDRRLNRRMRRMRFVPERIEEEHIQSLELSQGRLWNCAVVRQIRD